MAIEPFSSLLSSGDGLQTKHKLQLASHFVGKVAIPKDTMYFQERLFWSPRKIPTRS